MENLNGKLLILVFLIVSLLNNYILSTLGMLHVSSGQTLLGRGLTCVLCSLIGGLIFNEQIVPKKYNTQIIRLFFAGFGLWATVESYLFARASEISLISRLDLPILIIFGFLISLKTSRQQKWTSTVLILSIVLAIILFADEKTTLHGLFLAASGTTTLSLSYLLLNRTAKTESAAVVSLTPGVACLIFGASVMVFTKQSFNSDPLVITLTLLSGITMYFAYRVVRHLYRRYEFLKAQIAYILIPIVSIPIDIIGFERHFSLLEYFVFLLISSGVVITCLIKEQPKKIVEGEGNEHHKATA